MQIRGLLFDLDGTLIETEKANHSAYNLALSEFGLGIDYEHFRKYVGIDSRHFLAESFPNLKASDVNRIRTRKSTFYKEFFSETILNRNLFSFIDQFQTIERIGIVTTGKRDNVFDILDYHGVRNKFDLIITGSDVENPKPDAEPYLKAIELIGLPSNQILAFEDSAAGCISAIAANLKVIQISTGNQDVV